MPDEVSNLMNKRELRRIIADIKRHKEAIGQHRDALRSIYSDLEDIVDSSDEGMRLLEDSVEELSGYL